MQAISVLPRPSSAIALLTAIGWRSSTTCGALIDPDDRWPLARRSLRHGVRVAQTQYRRRRPIWRDFNLGFGVRGPQPQQRRADPTGAQASCVRGQHQILSGSAAILDPARYDDHSGCAPEHRKFRSLGPVPSGLVRVMIPGVLLGLIAVRRNAFDALYDMECPWHLAAIGWRRLSSVPDHLFDEFPRHRAWRI